MRLLAARKLGMVSPPPVPGAPAPYLLQRAPVAPGPLPAMPYGQPPPGQPGLPPHLPPAASGPPPPVTAAVLQQLAAQLSCEPAGGPGGEAGDVQRIMGLLAQGLAAAGAAPGGAAGEAGPGRPPAAGPGAAPPTGQQGQVPARPAAGSKGAAPPGAAGAAAGKLPLAHNPQLGKLFSAPAHHIQAAPVPATIKVPARPGVEHAAAGGSGSHKQGPMPFSAPTAANLFPGFTPAGGNGGASGSGGAEPRAANQEPLGAGVAHAQPRPTPPLQQPQQEWPASRPAQPPPQQQQQQVPQHEWGSRAAEGQGLLPPPPTADAGAPGQGQGSAGLPQKHDAALRLLAALQQQQQQQQQRQ